MAETDSAKLIGATGDCLLVLSKTDLYCASASSHRIVGVWPYDSLRRYYCKEGMFGFVAGRRSPRGEGEFKFVTSQKEDIYHRLERAILRAKRSSEGSTSSAEGSKDVDSRPPAPLPSGEVPPQRKETPVPTSESDEDIFPSDPNQENSRSLNPPSVKRLMTEPVASDISPAYGQFNSKSGRSGRSQQTPWLHESVSAVPQPRESHRYQSSDVASKRPPLPQARNSQISMVASEEDTYSHTVHPVPEQFQKSTMEHNVIGGNVYNALVHQRSHGSLHGKSSKPTSEADTNLYDVAFPEGRRVISSGDYAVARHPDMAQYKPGAPKLPPRRMATIATMTPGRDMTDGVGKQSQETQRSKSSSPPPAVVKEKIAVKEDDGLTANPLYGSQDVLLTELALLDEQIKEMELETRSTTAGGERPASAGAAALPGMMDYDEADQQFTNNPIYGSLEEEQKKKLLEGRPDLVSLTERSSSREGQREGETRSRSRDGEREGETRSRSRDGEREGETRSRSREGETTSGKEETPQPIDNSLLCESDQNVAQTSQEKDSSARAEQSPTATAAAAASEGGIQRDGKGYSKVDKSKKASEGGREDVSDGGGSEKTDSKEKEAVAAATPQLESQGSDDSENTTPPPLPERNYSFDESELNKPPMAARRDDS